jgi:hypothetical protein
MPLAKNPDFAIKAPLSIYAHQSPKEKKAGTEAARQRREGKLRNDKDVAVRKQVGTTSIPSNIDKGGAHKNRGPAVGDTDLFGGKVDPHQAMKGLKREFTFPPFSVLNSRDGHWMARKRLWWSLGVKGENKRGVTMAKAAQHLGGPVEQSLSLWDPVVCELMVKWFCPPGGLVLDPFCGYSIGGVVASCCGRKFMGVDLSQAQVDANCLVGPRVCKNNHYPPCWYQGDSTRIHKHPVVSGYKGQIDLLFSCPPYSHLELYSEDSADLSNMTYEEFLVAYRKVIRRSVSLLAPDSFAVWVVGEVRTVQKTGRPYYGFVQNSIAAFKEAGMEYYNEIILLTSIGSLPLRTRQAFISSRKIGKAHQNILVFCKGDPKAAAARINQTLGS